MDSRCGRLFQRHAAPIHAPLHVRIPLPFVQLSRPGTREGTAVERLNFAKVQRRRADLSKVGMQLYTAEGPHIVREARGRESARVPRPQSNSYPEHRELCGGKARSEHSLTVHVRGGKTLCTAVEAAQANPGLMVLAVTVLTTSWHANDLEKIGIVLP